MKPKTRLENFLAKIAGSSDAKEMEPKTRVEHFLNDIAQSGGGVFVVHYVLQYPSGVTVTESYEDVVAAYNAEKLIVLHAQDGGLIEPVSCYVDESSNYIEITSSGVILNDVDKYYAVRMFSLIYSDGSWSWESTEKSIQVVT